jgi:hypothetical protein
LEGVADSTGDNFVDLTPDADPLLGLVLDIRESFFNLFNGISGDLEVVESADGTLGLVEDALGDSTERSFTVISAGCCGDPGVFIEATDALLDLPLEGLECNSYN